MNILAIFPHPDDLVIHAAGSLARWKNEGHHVAAISCTSGNLGTLRDDETGAQVAAIREAEMRAAHEILGIASTEVLGYPDGGLLDAAKLRRELVGCVRKHRPDRVLTVDPWVPYEVHPDHTTVGRMAAEAAAFAAFPLLYPEQLTRELRPHAVPEVWFMGPLANAANCYVNIASTLDTKIDAMLKFEATLAIIASYFSMKLDANNISAEERQTLSRRADEWIRKMAGKFGEKAGMPAAEAFLVQKCIPGHFDNFDGLLKNE